MANIINGIDIGLIGTAVLFASLGLLSLIIRLVNELFQPETAVPVPTPVAPAQPELAAAIAVSALRSMSTRKKQADLGHLLEQAPGQWRRSPATAPQLPRKE